MINVLEDRGEDFLTLPIHPPGCSPGKLRWLCGLRKAVDNWIATRWKSFVIFDDRDILPLVVGRETGRRKRKRLLTRRPTFTQQLSRAKQGDSGHGGGRRPATARKCHAPMIERSKRA